MFHQITLKNYRTHVNTTIDLGPVTLLIGNNNSGKSNLLAGIRHFSQLIAAANPQKTDPHDQLRPGDLFPHRHRLAAKNEPMGFACKWSNRSGEVDYQLELREDQKLPNKVAVKEVIQIRLKKGTGAEKTFSRERSDRLILRNEIENEKTAGFSAEQRKLCEQFFRDLAQAFAYHFQPSYLKDQVKVDWPIVDPKHLRIPSQLGYEGGNLETILLHYQERDAQAFQRFLASLRRFEPCFHGVRKGKHGRLVWEFDLGHKGAGRLDEFGSEVISDGMMKAAAVSLLTTIRRPPALLMIEEIENGVNPANIEEFMSWLWQAATTNHDEEFHTQILLTSHSPSVLRQFNEQLKYVYTVRLDRRGFKSDVRNLAQALDTLIGIGTIDGEIVEVNGQKIVRIPPGELAELWYSGTIG